MLDTELDDREPDNNGPAGAGHSDAVTESPAEAGQDSGAGPDDQEADGSGRRLFRRGRRAVTRPAGPPTHDAAGGGGSGPDGGESAGAQPAAVPAAEFTASSPAKPGTSQGAPEFQGARGFQGSSGFQSPQWSQDAQESREARAPESPQAAFQPPLVIFQPPEITSSPARRTAAGGESAAEADAPGEDRAAGAGEQDSDGEADSSPAKRRRRGGRGHAKGRGAGDEGTEPGADPADDGGDAPARSGKRTSDGAASAAGGRAASGKAADGAAEESEAGDGAEGPGDASDTPARRRRRRRRSGSTADGETQAPDDPPNTVVHVRAPRAAAPDSGTDVKGVSGTDVKGVKGSTRLEAKRQRRREGRESGRRRPPIITESEFLARREAVERIMVVRQHEDRTQIAVLEDGILVEHYVDKASHQSYVGNVYLGRVQNVLPSMEAAFVDIGKGRNAVLYAGEVNFDASGLEGESKRIESALKSGQSILVQATKDPIGHKGARLTSQVSLPGRYLVYVPGANMTGISRKLPDTERSRLKQILKQVMPENAGVIVRTAAEGATEEELSHDVARLAAQWEAIERKAKSATAPDLLYSEPDLTIRVVRDIFNEDFTKLVIASDGDWDMVDEYVRYVAPTLAERLQRWTDDEDVFAAYRIDEQLAKALERKVWLPSGGSLVIDATEAMTVIDVNTGKFTGQGGNLEQTVTRNNLEAAEEIVRQLRVRDVGGIIVIDFIDMVLESNRDLVLRRLLECLARDRTKHQVAEVTSLGLVQMTRKRVGSGLLEAFSVPCEHCNGRGVIVSLEPVDHAPASDRHGRDGGSRDGSSKDGGSRDGASRNGAAREGAAKGGSARGGASGGGRGSPGGGAGQAKDTGEDGAAAEKPADLSDDGTAAGGDGAGSRRSSGGRRRRRAADGHGAGSGDAAGSGTADGHGGGSGDAAGSGAADGHGGGSGDAAGSGAADGHGGGSGDAAGSATAGGRDVAAGQATGSATADGQPQQPDGAGQNAAQEAHQAAAG